MESSKTVFTFCFGLFLSFVMMFADQLGWMGWLRGSVELLMRPEIQTLSSLIQDVRTVSDEIAFARTGQDTVRVLSSRLTTLQAQLLLSQKEKEQGQALSKILSSHVPRMILEGATPTHVISASRWMTIENQGFSAGEVVLSPEGGFVGIIDQVGRWTARVKLPTDPDSAIPVLIVPTKTSFGDGVKPSTGNIDGMLAGTFGGAMKVERVLTSVEVMEGQVVVTKGSDQAIPPGLLIGWTKRQPDKQESAVYQSARVDWAVNPQTLTVVVVVRSENP